MSMTSSSSTSMPDGLASQTDISSSDYARRCRDLMALYKSLLALGYVISYMYLARNSGIFSTVRKLYSTSRGLLSSVDSRVRSHLCIPRSLLTSIRFRWQKLAGGSCQRSKYALDPSRYSTDHLSLARLTYRETVEHVQGDSIRTDTPLVVDKHSTDVLWYAQCRAMPNHGLATLKSPSNLPRRGIPSSSPPLYPSVRRSSGERAKSSSGSDAHKRPSSAPIARRPTLSACRRLSSSRTRGQIMPAYFPSRRTSSK